MVKKTTKKKSSQKSIEKNTKAKISMPSTKRGIVLAIFLLIRVVVTIALLIGMAYLITWMLTVLQNKGDADLATTFMTEKPDLYSYSVLVVFCCLAVITAVTLRPILSAGIGFAIAAALGYANYQKLLYRDAPLIPEDLSMLESAGNLTQFVDMGEVTRLIIGIILLIIGCFLLNHYLHKWMSPKWQERRWWEKVAVIPRAVLLLVTITLTVLVTKPIMQRDGYQGWLDNLSLEGWSQTINYENNGFVIGFLYNMGRLKVAEPEGYSEARMNEIAEKYRAIKAQDTGRQKMSDAATNFVMILNETFYDPELFTKYYPHAGGDVIPNVHRLFTEYPSGYMYSPGYGGGTANIEFEVQTGLSNFWADDTPYVNSLSKLDSVLSPAAWAKLYGTLMMGRCISAILFIRLWATVILLMSAR